MKRLILWGFGEPDSDITNLLKANGYEVALHFVEKPISANQLSFSDLHSGQFLKQPFINNQIEIRAPKKIREKIVESFGNDYLLFNARQTMLIGCNTLTKRDSFNDLNLLYFLIDYFYDKISKHNVDAVIFSSMPHEGADFILYHVAKAVGKRVVICYQSIFDNRFFMLNAIDDLGDVIGTTKEIAKPIELKIKKEFEKKLQYMDMVADAKQHYDKVRARTKFGFAEVLKIISKTIRGKKSWIDSFFISKAQAVSRIGYLNDYISSLQEATTHNIDFTKKFIYFPLHLQPEVTTAPLGGKYCDQISAIEDLAEILPEDFFIYVKENPKQIETMRSREFFARMMRVNNVMLVPITTNTYDLTRNCQFVATVTGTVGWEAVTGGKCVLTFGHAWYNNLPGVFKYSNSIKISDIINHKIDHEALQEKFSELSTRLAEGYVDKEFINYSDKPYNREKNHQNIFASVNKFLNQ